MFIEHPSIRHQRIVRATGSSRPKEQPYGVANRGRKGVRNDGAKSSRLKTGALPEERFQRRAIVLRLALLGRESSAAQLTGRPTLVLAGYLEWFDPEAHDGRGYVQFTALQAGAKQFASYAAVLEFLRTRPKIRPLRPDGKPNRPLTGLNFAIEYVE
jgi:hypothetical protein